MKTDSQLQQDVIAELKWTPSVEAAKIGVEVKDGVVTLAGHVGSYAEKWDAEQAAQRVFGVRALAVEMEVTLPGAHERTDADIARSAKNMLEWTTYLTGNPIDVKVEKGWITLTGEVRWQYQRQSAVSAVRYLLGVRGVSDQITLKPQANTYAVKADIVAAIKRRATTDAQAITVDVRGGDVTLTGEVSNWTERDVARTSAWGSAGVSNVVDNMTVA